MEDQEQGSPGALHKAAHYGDTATVVRLLEAGGCVEDIDAERWPMMERPLHVAAAAGHQDVVNLLLAAGADAQARNALGQSPLHLACSKADFAICKKLIEAGAEVDADASCYSFAASKPLQLACLAKRDDVCALLLAKGAAPCVSVIGSSSALLRAIRYMHPSTVVAFVKAGAASPNQSSKVNQRLLGMAEALKASRDGKEQAQKLFMAATLARKHRQRFQLQNEHSQLAPLFEANQISKEGVVDIDHEKAEGCEAPKAHKRLCQVCMKGDADGLRALLEAGHDLKQTPDNEDEVPLLAAIEGGHLEVVSLLLEAGAPVMSRNKEQHTPLHIACYLGHTVIAEALLKAGADLEAVCKQNGTPLNYACYQGKEAAVKLLLVAGANVNAKGNVKAAPGEVQGETPLHAACRMGHCSIVSLLLTAGANVEAPDVAMEGPLHAASREGHLEVVKVLLAAGADVNGRNAFQQTALMYACSNNHPDAAKLLLQSGANVGLGDEDGNQAVHLAAGDAQTLQLVLEAGASVCSRNKMGERPVLLAACYGTVEALGILLAAGADLNAVSDTGKVALHYACCTGTFAMVQKLLVLGAEINTQCQDGYTPLQKACYHGRARIVQLLVRMGANLELRECLGLSALQLASLQGHTSVARILLEAGAKVEGPGDNVLTPLQLACTSGHDETARVLLAAGADLHAPACCSGGVSRSLLQLACLEGHESTVGLLLERGASTSGMVGPFSSILHYALHHLPVGIILKLVQGGAVADKKLQSYEEMMLGMAQRWRLVLEAKLQEQDLLLAAAAELSRAVLLPVC